MDCGSMMPNLVDYMCLEMGQHSALGIGATNTINIKDRTIIMGNSNQNNKWLLLNNNLQLHKLGICLNNKLQLQHLRWCALHLKESDSYSFNNKLITIALFLSHHLIKLNLFMTLSYQIIIRESRATIRILSKQPNSRHKACK